MRSNSSTLNNRGEASREEMEAGTGRSGVTPSIQHFHVSAAKFWCKFDGGDATPITADASYNVVDITKSATGIYVVNIDTNFSSANFAPLASSSGGNTFTNSLAAGTVGVRTTTSGDVDVDAAIIVALGFGDQ